MYGSTDFSPVAPPWKYDFNSGNPVDWVSHCTVSNPGVCIYDADYLSGGTITILGPGGLIFSGIFSDGTYSSSAEFDLVQFHLISGEEAGTFNFFGKWTNGVDGWGTIYNFSSFNAESQTYHNEARLDLYAIPEPGTLMLLGSGTLLILSRVRQRIR